MKRYLLLIISLLMFIPCIVNAEECDVSKVYIESLTADGNTNIETDSMFEDKVIRFSALFYEQGENVRFKIVIKNDSNEDYILDKDSINHKTDYVKYTIESDDNSYLLKANSTRAFYLRVNYYNAVPQGSFSGDYYQEPSNIKMNLRPNNSSGLISNLSNPNTRMNYIIIIGILLFMILVFVVFRKKRKVKIFIIIATLLLIPFGVRAICTCEIEIESYIYVSSIPRNPFYIENENTGEVVAYKFDEGMTWAEWLESEYNVDGITFSEQNEGCVSGNSYMNMINNNSLIAVRYNDYIEANKHYRYETIDICDT